MSNMLSIPTSHQYTFEKPHLQNQRTTSRDSIRVYSRWERIFEAIDLHSHRWTFPIRLRGVVYPTAHTAHQNCTDCSASRLYCMETMRGGAMFRWNR